MACGHVLDEPSMQDGAAAWTVPGLGDHVGSPLTPSEQLILRRDPPGNRRRTL
jgi:hypothetical protein